LSESPVADGEIHDDVTAQTASALPRRADPARVQSQRQQVPAGVLTVDEVFAREVVASTRDDLKPAEGAESDLGVPADETGGAGHHHTGMARRKIAHFVARRHSSWLLIVGGSPVTLAY
jgi:hypothetical protein